MAFGREVGTKLSVKSFGFDKAKVLETVLTDKEAEFPLVRFVGIATGLRKYKIPANQVKDGVDEGYGLSGDFTGQSIDGEVKAGNVLYLNRAVTDMVASQMELNDDVAGIKIAFDVYAKYNVDAATSYVYVTRDVLNESSPNLDAMLKGLEGVPALGAAAPAQLEGPKPKK